MPVSNKGLGLLGVLSVIGIAAVIVIPSLGSNAAVANNNASSGTVAFTPGFDKTPDEALCTNNHYINSSTLTVLAGDVEYRQFATAVSIPFKGTTDAAVSKEIISENCGNPTELKMVVDDMMLWSGFPGAEENKSWISEIQADMNKQGLDSFSGTNEAGEKIVSPQFQEYAGWINTVLLRFNTEGEQSLTSVRNWELPATVDPATQPVAVLATDQESKPSWVRTLLDKNGACLYKIGFNAEDKRIETFNCEVPPMTPTTTTTTTTPPTTPPTITPVCPPETPHGIWPVCKDDPSKAPNGSEGNGLSHDPTPVDPSPTPTQPPTTPRVDPTPPAPAPVATPDPAPAPSLEPSAPAPSDPATGCSPAPGMTTC